MDVTVSGSGSAASSSSPHPQASVGSSPSSAGDGAAESQSTLLRVLNPEETAWATRNLVDQPLSVQRGYILTILLMVQAAVG